MTKLFRKAGEAMEEIAPTSLKEMSEKALERMLITVEDFLGERLLVIGEQTDFPEMKGDAIDLIALDEEGAVVVIELKRGETPSDVDFQVLKYAAYISHLDADALGQRAFEFFQRQENSAVRERLKSAYGVDFPDSADTFDLAQILARFFEKETPEVYEGRINTQQRLVVLAEAFDNRIALVIDWLNRQGIDISAWQYEKFAVGNETLFTLSQVIPVPDLIGPIEIIGPPPKKPWLKDGRKYHLAVNCGDTSSELLLQLEQSLVNVPGVSFKWTQKLYIKVVGPGKREVRVYTGTSKKRLDVLLMHAPIPEVEQVLDSTGIPRAKNPEFYWYDQSSAWFKLESPGSLSDMLKQRLRNWLLHHSDRQAPELA